MNDIQKFLRKMISDYEEILNLVSSKLSELKSFASQHGLQPNLDVTIPENEPAKLESINDEIEKKKQEMMSTMQKIREDAQKQAAQAMQEATKTAMGAKVAANISPSGMPNMMGGGLGGFPGMPGIAPNMGNINDPITNMPSKIMIKKEEKKDEKK